MNEQRRFFDLAPEELLACAQRELAMRRRVYPRLIENNKMTREKAEHEIMCMEGIVALLQRDIDVFSNRE